MEDQREKKIIYAEYDQFLGAESLLILLPPVSHRLQTLHLLSEKKEFSHINKKRKKPVLDDI